MWNGKSCDVVLSYLCGGALYWGIAEAFFFLSCQLELGGYVVKVLQMYMFSGHQGSRWRLHSSNVLGLADARGVEGGGEY